MNKSQYKFTDREKEILKLIILGKNNKEIAKSISVPVAITIKSGVPWQLLKIYIPFAELFSLFYCEENTTFCLDKIIALGVLLFSNANS